MNLARAFANWLALPAALFALAEAGRAGRGGPRATRGRLRRPRACGYNQFSGRLISPPEGQAARAPSLPPFSFKLS